MDWDNNGSNELVAILDRFETIELYDTNDLDGTGAHVFGSKPFALAWGQDNTEHSPGEPLPDFDYGFKVLPLYWFEPVLGIEKGVNPTNLPTSGGTSMVTLVVNTETQYVYDVDIGDTLPPGWQFVTNSVTITFSDGTPSLTNNPSVTNRALYWNLDYDLSPTQTITVTFGMATISGAYDYGWHVNEGQTWGYSLNDPGNSNRFVFNPQDYAFLYIPAPPSLVMDKSSPTNLLDPGDTFTYTITITNIGATAQTGIRVRDYVPTGVTYVANSTWVVTPNAASNSVLDRFDDVWFGNNDGTADWLNEWQEQGEADGEAAGDVLVTNSVNTNVLRTKDDLNGAWRMADLSGATSAVFSFGWRRFLMDLPDTGAVYVSANGGTTWNQLVQYVGNSGSDAALSYTSFNITAWISTNTAVRFYMPDAVVDDNEGMDWDNVQITYYKPPGTTTNAGDPPSILADGYSLPVGGVMTVTFDVLVDNPALVTNIINTAYVRSDQQDQLEDTVTNRVITSTLGDWVWHDLNTNGIQDAGETGIVGVTVNLYDGSTNFLRSTTTDTSGYYAFSGLPPANYVIRFELPTSFWFSPQNQGGSDTNDSDASVSTGYTPVFSLARGTNETIWDAGMYSPPVPVGDYVWFDANTNGIQDAGESGMDGVTLRIYDVSTNLVATTNSDVSGFYFFGGLAPGDYFLEVVPPADYTLTVADQGGSDTNDSDFSKVTQRTIVFYLPPGTNTTIWDAGLIIAVPGLQVTKTSDIGANCREPGDTITYTITVVNTGVVDHAITTVTDNEPAGTTYVPGSTLVAAPAFITNTVRDEFNTVAYTNNNGTFNWANNWQEQGEAAQSPSAGDVRVTNLWGAYQLRILFTNNGAWRQANLSSYTNAVLSFDYRRIGLDNTNEYIGVYASSNGGVSWAELGRLLGPGTDAATRSTNYNITAYIATNTAIRFFSTNTLSVTEGAGLDNVQILFTKYAIATNAGGPPPTLVDGYTVVTDATMVVTFQVTVDTPGTLTQIVNTAIVTSKTQPPVSHSVTDCVVFADLGVVKSASYSAPPEGAAIQYDLVLTNNGPDTATGVEVTDLLPEGVQYHSHSNGTYNSISGIWDVGTLAVGAFTTLYISVTIDEGTAGTAITNWAQITANDLFDPVPTNNQDDAVVTPVPTLALICSFRAYADEGGVHVEWETGGEVGTIGFNLYRFDDEADRYQPVNERLLPGLIVAPQGGTYSLRDAGATAGRRYLYRLEEVEADGNRNQYGPFEVFVAAGGAGGGAAKASLARAAPAPASLGKVSEAILNYLREPHPLSEGKKARTAARLAERKQAGSGAPAVGSRVKATLREEGLYYVSAGEAAGALNLPMATVQWLLSRYQMLMMNQGRYANYIVAGKGQGLYWYGEALDSIYTDDNAYWLSLGRGGKPRTVSGRSPRPAAQEGTFMDTVSAEENRVAAPAIFRDPEADIWLWCFLLGGFPGFDRTNLPVCLEGVATAGTARVSVWLKGGSASGGVPDHHVLVFVNGVGVGEGVWAGLDEHRIDAAFDQRVLREGVNTVEVRAVLDQGVPWSVVYVDALDLTYARYYRAVDERLLVRGGGNKVITISGFTNGQISVVDVTDPRQPAVLKNTTIDLKNGRYRVSFVPASARAEYFAFTGGGVRRPLRAVGVVPSQLGLPWNRAKYAVITVPELREQAQILADYRAAQGLETRVINVEEIYDAFNWGIASPEAIRAFLRYAYWFWSVPPEYVVLAGEGTFDYKDHMGYGDNLVPTKMVDTPDGLFESDTWYGDVYKDDGIPEMAVGRLPVMTAEELAGLIAKIALYESASGDPAAGGAGWTRQMMLVADNKDEGGDFPTDSDDVGMWVPGGYVVSRVYMPPYDGSGARTAIQNGWNAGLMLLQYIGHGVQDRFAGEGILRISDVPSLNSGEKMPVVVALTCLTGRYSLPGYDCLGEALLMRAGGGAAAVWSPTGLSMNYMAEILGTGFFQARFTDGELILGDAVRSALEDYRSSGQPPYMLYIYNLLGDPALHIK